MYKDRQNFDNIAWDKNDDTEEESQMRPRRKNACRQVESLVKQKCGKPATLVSPLVIGGLNIHYRIYLEGEDSSSDVIVRLPWPYAACFPGEKVVYEAATAEYLRLNTHIPAAQVLYLLWSGFYCRAVPYPPTDRTPRRHDGRSCRSWSEF